jgi:hypothetical protein
MNDSVMMSRLKNSAGPTCTLASPDQRPSLAESARGRMLAMPVLELLVSVLDHDDRGVDHRADRDRDAAERHDVGVDALVVHDDEGREHAERQRDDRDEAERRWNRKAKHTSATTMNSSTACR